MKTGQIFRNIPAGSGLYSALLIGAIVLSFTLLTSFRGASIQVADDSLSSWDKAVLKQANTAESVTYLSDEEKKLIFYTNLCRLKPKLFCQTVLADYLKTHIDKPAQIASLKKQLNEDKAMDVLVPDQELSIAASRFAMRMGEQGKTGILIFKTV
jgi:hypothetical protein